MNLNKSTNPRTTEPLPPYLLENPLNAQKPNNVIGASVEPVKLNAKQRKKQEKKAARLAEEALQAAQQQQEQQQMRKESLDETCSVATTTSTATSKAQLPPTKVKLSKKEAKKAAAKAKNEPKVEEIVQMTRNITLEEPPRSKPSVKAKAEIVVPKKERRRVKTTKFEYADPQYAKNKFDVLNMDDDDFESESDDDNANESVSPSWRARSSTAESNKYSRDSSFTTVQKTRAEKAKAQKQASEAWNREAKAALAAKAAGSSTSFTVRPQSPYVRDRAPPQPIEIQLTKKQLKKMAQQQTRLAAQQAATAANAPKPTASNSSSNASQSMAQTLKNSMQKLSLNDDTTIELVREQQRTAAVGTVGPPNPSVSIIDQLSRGIQMEGLTLPPGITLTRVDPAQAEQIRAKKESIGRVCTFVFSYLCVYL